MSLPFNVAFTGIVQQFEKEIGANRGDIANDTNRLKEFAALANLALDDYTALALRSSGAWQFDDSNHTDYPFIEADLVANQRSYTFTTDENNNVILDVYKVMVKSPTGIYTMIDPVDQQNGNDMESFYNGEDTTGIPTRYDKTGNGIFLDVIPNYSWRLAQESEKGLKVFINRESSYFTYTDTTRKAGIRGTHHKYLYLKPALDYARRNNLNSYLRIESEIIKIESEVKKDYSQREKDKQETLSPEPINSI